MKKEKILKYWLILLFLSFAYEKPILVLTSIDRINPRLFDFVTLLGVFILPIAIQKANNYINPIFQKWKILIFWFGVCAGFSVIFYGFPALINSYIIFSYAKYLQELFILFLVTKITSKLIPLKEIIHIMLISGIFVFLYSIYELNYGEYGSLEFAPGKYTIKPEGVIWGPYGNTYFQIANFLPLIFIMSIAYSTMYRGVKKVLLFFISGMIAYPLFFTGSRTGLFLLLFSLIVFLLIRYKLVYTIILSSLLAVFIIFNSELLMNEEFLTIQRLESMEETGFNSIQARISNFLNFDISSYEESGILMPFIGGGFYVAPVNGNFRIDYGAHNIFLFSFEQAGLLGFILFISVLITSNRQLRKGIKLFKRNKGIEFTFLAAIFSYFIASLIIGIAGHTFWRGFATNNMNTLRLAILIIASNVYLIHTKTNLTQNEKNTSS